MNAALMEDLDHVSKSALILMDLLIAAVTAVTLLRDQIALVRMSKIVSDWYQLTITIILLILLFAALDFVHTTVHDEHTYI